jgi:PAS domain S-box-containing protein
MSTRVVGWLARALHATRDGAFATTDGKVVLWNAAAERLLGYTAHDVLGQPWSDVIRVPERDAARVGDILGLLAHGLNTVRVAERLRVSRATVRNHVQNILDKLGVHSRLEAVAYATRPRLV